jgi:preprotein translocase subunit SecE
MNTLSYILIFLGVILLAILIWFFWNNVSAVKVYFQESYTELIHKVTWPTWSELQNSAVLVMVASLIFAVLVAGMDFVFSRSMQFIYSLLY